MEVIVWAVFETQEPTVLTATLDSTYSPKSPAVALSLVDVPVMKLVRILPNPKAVPERRKMCPSVPAVTAVGTDTPLVALANTESAA
jgi:hypothetical protein